jgi:hypothetical protein
LPRFHFSRKETTSSIQQSLRKWKSSAKGKQLL